MPAGVCIAFADSRKGPLFANGGGLRVVVTPGVYAVDQDFEGAAVIFSDMPRLTEIMMALS